LHRICATEQLVIFSVVQVQRVKWTRGRPGRISLFSELQQN